MRKINTTLTYADSDEAIVINLSHSDAFSGFFKLSTLLNTRHPKTKQFATDATSLHRVKDQLECAQNQFLWGLQGIGGLMVAANPADLSKDDLASVGGLIQSLAQLAEDVVNHTESVNSDLFGRSSLIDCPKRAAYHGEVHLEAMNILHQKWMSYPDAVTMAAGRLSARTADETAAGIEGA